MGRSSLAVVAASVLCAETFAAPAWVPADFHQWAREHGKRYTTEHAWRRALENFRSNARSIDALNADADDGAEYGHTHLSDLAPLEFAEAYLPAVMDPTEGKRGGAVVDLTELESSTPSAVDWRDQGAVTPVKNQKSCGSCWAESAVSNIESMWFLANKASLKAPVELSTEQVIECDTHDYACYGGYPKGAYQYVIESGGLAAEADYPYNVDGHTICLANQTYNETCGDGICDDPPLTNSCDETCSDKATTHKPVAKLSSWLALPADEDQIASYLAIHGPVSIGLDASGGSWGVLFPWLQFYKNGVANPGRCTSRINHGVVLVGYGEDGGKKYWTVKNSWGSKWGESGYFRLIRGAGKCGVALMATSAVIAGAPAIASDSLVV